MISDPTVFIVDDDPSVLKSIARLIHSAGLSAQTFSSPREFLDRQSPDHPGCLVLDISMPGLNGLDLQQALKESGNTLPIVFITGKGDIPTSVRAMKAGALDFLTKPFDDETFLGAVHQAIEKDRLNRQQQLAVEKIKQRLAKLSPREYEVLTHVIAGKLNKQIAADLGTVEKTIKVHRARVMTKMDVQSVAELVRLAEQANITPNSSSR